MLRDLSGCEWIDSECLVCGVESFLINVFSLAPLLLICYFSSMTTNRIAELKITDHVLGTGLETSKGALVFCHYTGWLDDGTQFDSSVDRGTPFEFVFGVGRVITGWDQGLIGMKVGGKRRLEVPSHLAYGERQIGKFITPNSSLTFEVELLEVRPRE